MTVTSMQNVAAFSGARKIVKTLRPAENAIDQSLIENARLLEAMVSASLAAKLAPEVGRAAVATSIEMIRVLGEARQLGITCHQQLTEIRDAFGWTGNDVGCTVNKSPATSDVIVPLEREAA